MALSNDLISQFVKITKDNTKTKKESTVYGTTVEYNGAVYVKLDGSELLTPVSTTTDMNPGERVTVMIKNHTATVMGNMSSPSARTDDVKDSTKAVKEMGSKISEFEIIIADKVSVEDFDAQSARIDDLNTEIARIDELEADVVTINEKLEAIDIVADVVTINEKLTAVEADISDLKANKLDVTIADAKYATIEELDTTNANVHNLEATYGDFASLTTDKLTAIDTSIKDLETKKLSAEDAKITYANIDFSNIGKAAIEYFYATSGLIEDVVVGDGTVTGRLVGVTISGDLIEGNTVIAEKLVIKGDDGLYYKLNTDGMTTEAEQTDYNSLNGSIIKAKSITATKISVSDLVAFGATIGGINIASGALYSGAKNSVNNTAIGVYLDKHGQIAIGDANNYIKYYTDANGDRKLVISADSMLLGSSSKNIETAISDVETAVDNIEVGGRNLLIGSATKKITPYLETTATSEYGIEVTEWLTDEAMRIYGTGGTAAIFGTMGGTSCHGAAEETKMYSASIYIKNNHSTNTVTITGNHLSGIYVNVAPLEEKRVELVGFGNGLGYLQFNFKTSAAGDDFDITYWHPKIEFGNKPTDWTPAPEDMATSDDMKLVEDLAEAANAKADTANSLIQQLSDSISMLVTDGSGASLMTQTENGWTFSTAEMQAIIDRTSEGLNDLTNDVGDVNSTVSILQQAVDDLGTIAEYVKIGTYEDEPCIELGEGDSDFKLIITNTRIMFMEGTGVPAYINNQSLYIRKAVVEEELQQGGFIWKARSNGNLGLVWKGVTE